MTGNDASKHLFNTKTKGIAWVICKSNLHKEDLLCEAILVLIESKTDFNDLAEAEKFLVHTMFRLWTQSRGDFAAKYKQFEITQSIDGLEIEEEQTEEGRREYISPHLVGVAMDKIRWYNRELIQMKAEGKSYRAIEKETGINHNSVYHAIMQGCKQIKEYLNVND